jgi:hypothetical protein
MSYDYGTDVETLVTDCLPHAMNAQNTDWRLRAKAFIEAVERRHWKIAPPGERLESLDRIWDLVLGAESEGQGFVAVSAIRAALTKAVA